MSIIFSCSECGKKYKAGEQLVGKRFKCRGCGSEFIVKPLHAKATGITGAKAAAQPASYAVEDKALSVPSVEEAVPRVVPSPSPYFRQLGVTLLILGVGCLILPIFGLEWRRFRGLGEFAPVGGVICLAAGLALNLFTFRARLEELLGTGGFYGLLGGVGALAVAGFFLVLMGPSLGRAPAGQGPRAGPQASADATPAPDTSPAASSSSDELFAVVFSSPTMERGTGARMSFSVNYRIQQGKPNPGGRYFLVIRSAQGASYEVNYVWRDLKSEGTLQAQGFTIGRDRGPFEVCMETEKLGRGRLEDRRHRVSNSVKVEVSPVAEAPASAPRSTPPLAKQPSATTTKASAAGSLDVTQALAELQSADHLRRRKAADYLVKAKPDQRREEVAKALESLLTDADVFVRQSAAKALMVWAAKENVPALIETLKDTNPLVRKSALEALGEIKDSRAVEPVAARLADLSDRQQASKALQAMGSMVENAVLPFLKDNEVFVRVEAGKILNVVGTKESIPALKSAAKDKNGLVARAAQEALQSIAQRSK